MGSQLVLGIIPARGGSKGIPRKNVAPLAGQPLLTYTALATRDSRLVTRTVLSTDSEEIAGIGRELGLEVPFLRPPHLAQDDTPTLSVIQHLLHALGDRDKYSPDVVVVLQPTSPLRTGAHIDAAVHLLWDTGAASVVSVCPVEHPVDWLRRLDSEHRVRPTLPGAQSAARRQAAEPVYRLNGAIYVTRPSVIAAGSLLGEDTRGFVMRAEESVDIDTPFDLQLAEFLLQTRSKGKGAEG